MKNRRLRWILWAVVLFSFLTGNYALAGGPAEIKSFSPQGVVKGVRQATATFSEPMVPFGDPGISDPFTVQCPAKGQGRWIDSRTWAYDFSADLPGGVECEFRLQEGVKALSGASVSGKAVFRFATGGPAVVRSTPYEGNEQIDAGQIFVLYMDAAPQEASLTENVYFSVAGVKERVGINIVTGNERRKILKAINYKGDERLVVLVQARQAFPDAAAVKLIWGRGVASVSGVATEQDRVLSFRTREPFRAEFWCTREKADRACIPILPLGVRFTAPIPVQLAEQIVITDPQGKKWPGKIGDSERRRGIISYLTFPGPFPEKAKLTLRLPGGIRDEAGRILTNADKFPLPVSTDVYPPLAKFAARFGIIEAKGDRLLPVTIRNIERQLPGRLLKVDAKAPTPLIEAEEGTMGEQGEGNAPSGENTGTEAGKASGTSKASASGSPAFTGRLTGRLERIGADQDVKVIEWLRKIAAAERKAPILDRRAPSLSLPDRKQEKAFEVVGIPLPGPGFYIVELESRILGTHLLDPPAPLYIPAAALTTDMAAHFKWGREYSLVWVTSLDKGSPVTGADVVIRDCQGKALWRGKTDRTGVALIKTRLPNPDEASRCSGKVNYQEAPHALSNLGGGLFVFARNAGDMTFTHSSWDEGIEPWRFQLPTGGYSGEEGVVAHTILDRPLFRAGETAHMKHILRTHTSGGFALLPAAKRPDTLAIQHLGSDQTYRLPLRWHANGSAETTWKIPENARLGTYELALVKSKSSQDKKSADERQWRSGSFRVEEFRVPLMKALIQAPAKPLVNVRETPLDLSVSYLAGGGAALLPVRLRAEVQPKTIAFKDYEDFSFTGGPLREGIFPVSGREDLEEGQEAAAGEEPESPAVAANKPFKLPTQELRLGNQGVLRAALPGLPQVPTAREIHVEMEFRDPNGEIQTAAARIPLYPSRLAVGIRPDSWTAAQDNLNYKVAVVDLQGKPAPNVEATVDLYRQQTYSHRVRLVGGFYAYKSTREVKKIGRHCQGRTDGTGILACQGSSDVSGSVVLRAEVKDEGGLAAAANYDLWVAGKDDWWFEGGNDDRIDVLPERKKYEPGDKARFQVRMPFREATALVTVEREGILDIYIKKLSGKSPLVEIPVKKHYAPNVFVSVLVVRGRVGGGKPTATFDPGKPAYKLGVTEIRVGGQAHQLNVSVVPERTVYKVRDTMDVRIKVQGPAGRPLPKDAEVAIAAVDKGLLQLAPNDSWQLLKAMMQRRDYEVRTATAQAMVVGKRHFGQKSLSHGGGGGRQFTRELFDTLLFWQGRATLDARGEATVRIPLNDSLTGFRIVAVATAGTGLFGTGEADVQTTQDLMILSGLPPLVREGDRYRAVFTVRNASNRDMKIAGRLTVRSAVKAQEQEPRQETLSPGAARELAWWITVPPDTAGLEYEATVREEGGGAGSDRLKATQKVVPAVPVRTVQAVLTQVRTPVAVPIEKPEDAETGRGGISIQIKPVLAASLTGVRDYMDHYAYTCLEQKVSRAVALKDKALWQATMSQLPSYLDSDGLVKFFPVMRQGSDTLTAYVLAIAAEAGYGIPDYLRNRMTAGLRQFVEGKVIRYGALPTADYTIRKLAAIEALSSYGQAEAKLLTIIPVDPNLWPTSALLDWVNILRRVAGIPRGEERLKEGQQLLRARMNLLGTRMTFSTEGMDRLWWLMASADGNAVRSVLTLMDLEGWREDLPRLAAGALGRMRQGHWDTTTANAWGVLAMTKFSARYEKTPVGGTTQAALNGKTRTLDWQKASAGGALSFDWPTGRETMKVTHSGPGAPWATIRATAALRPTKPFSSGFQVTRTITKLMDNSDVSHSSTGTGEKGRGAVHASAGTNKNGGGPSHVAAENGGKERGSSHKASEGKGSAAQFSVGDIVRVRLDMEAQSDMTWVVINDPIPAGASILRTGLGGDSLMATAEEKTRGYAQEAFTERSQEAFRVYYEYIPKGKWSTEYTLRLNNEGVFQMPPSRLEALYAPEMFGETPVRPLRVTGKKEK